MQIFWHKVVFISTFASSTLAWTSGHLSTTYRSAIVHRTFIILFYMAINEEFSVALRRESKKVGLTPDQLAMADLVAVGWDAGDAWAMCVRLGLTWDRRALQAEIDKLVKSEAFQGRVAKTKEQLTASQLEKFVSERESIKKRDIKKKTSKDSLLQDLLAARENVRPGTLDYARMTMQIADLTNAKKEETVKEDTTIHFYTPLKCGQCSLYNKFKSIQQEEERDGEQSE